MGVRVTVGEAPGHWPGVDELSGLAARGELVFLPDRLIEREDRVVASFRADAQYLSARAKQQGIGSTFAVPAGAVLAVYSEHAADWVLPVVLLVGGAVLAVPANLTADLLHDRITQSHEAAVTVPEVRYREAIVKDGSLRVREIEGPADEVRRLLLERDQGSLVPDALPQITQTPPDGSADR